MFNEPALETENVICEIKVPTSISTAKSVCHILFLNGLPGSPANTTYSTKAGLTLTALNIFIKNMETKGFLSL